MVPGNPTAQPTTAAPSAAPTTAAPTTTAPTSAPTVAPTAAPTGTPTTGAPTAAPTLGRGSLLDSSECAGYCERGLCLYNPDGAPTCGCREPQVWALDNSTQNCTVNACPNSTTPRNDGLACVCTNSSQVQDSVPFGACRDASACPLRNNTECGPLHPLHFGYTPGVGQVDVQRGCLNGTCRCAGLYSLQNGTCAYAYSPVFTAVFDAGTLTATCVNGYAVSVGCFGLTCAPGVPRDNTTLACLTPTAAPTGAPTRAPTAAPTTGRPTARPSAAPSSAPTVIPGPTALPSAAPSRPPTTAPTRPVLDLGATSSVDSTVVWGSVGGVAGGLVALGLVYNYGLPCLKARAAAAATQAAPGHKRRARPAVLRGYRPAPEDSPGVVGMVGRE